MIFHNYWPPFIEFNNNIMIIIILIKLIIFDVAVPGDKRIGEKENEIARMWHKATLQVVPMVVGL